MQTTYDTLNTKHEIKRSYKRYILATKKTTKQGVELGRLFNTLKRMVKKNKKPWGKYADCYFPHINPRKRQRLMRIARKTYTSDHDTLYLLGENTLYSLCQISEGLDLQTFLYVNNITFRFELSFKSIKFFQDETSRLIKELATERTSAQRTSPPLKFSNWLKTVEHKPTQLSHHNLNTLKEINQIISRIIMAHQAMPL